MFCLDNYVIYDVKNKIVTGSAVHFSLLFSRVLFPLHLTEVTDSGSDLVQAVLLILSEAQNIVRLLQQHQTLACSSAPTTTTISSPTATPNDSMYLASYNNHKQ